jgi:hypothetical protein
MALGRPLGAKLFLEGKEVPFIGATMTSTVGQASIAYVDIVPHESIMNIRPRTRVEIFVRNYMQTETQATSGVPSQAFPYILAWKGEVFGYNFGKTPTSRTFSLSCIDHSSYWDNCLAYFFNAQQTQRGGLDSGSSVQQASDIIRGKEKFIPAYMTRASYFKTRIEQALKKEGSSEYDTSKDFMDGVISIYKDLGYVNEFFKLADERLRISDQIIMKSSGELTKLLKESEALDWFTGIPNNNSGYSTLRMVIQDLMSILFHDFVSAPFPAATVNKSMTKKGLPDPKNVKKSIGSYLFKPNLFMMPPPACNIFFPDEYSSFQFQRNFFKEPTRIIYMPELPARLGQGSAGVYIPHVYYPEAFSAFMKGRIGENVDAKYKGGNSFDIPENKNLSDLKTAGTEVSDKEGENYSKVNNGRVTDYNYLSNEETMKGIWLYREAMLPTTSAWRAALDKDYAAKTAFTESVAQYLFFKRRYQDRSLQITSHLKMSVMPGFPVLVLDDSAANQNVLAYCSSVTHRVYATEGGYTNVQLTYARYSSEEDTSSQQGAKTLTPPWFDALIFGPTDAKSSKTTKDKVGTLKAQGYPDALSDFYKTLLGDKGSTALSNLYPKDENTVVGSIMRLLEKYRAKKQSGSSDVMDFIASITARDYVKMKDYYKFFGATTTSKDVEAESWITFEGGNFDRSGKVDETASKLKSNEVTKYINTLKSTRGFRG